ncbi:MAG: hypothetical protein OER95_06745 [Acidimicrobiia bacterium]|nr:hypothetical protein [Acidimicrobiia bacterium]
MTATTLAQKIEPAAVGFDELEKDYRPMLRLVEQLIGVVPNCDPVLEIWPPGFRSYNLLVPNLLNLPASLVGQGAPKDLVGLAMYVASRAAECMYCSAHTCSFALRRGTTPEALVGNYSPEEAAVARVAEAIARVPVDITRADISELESFLSPGEIEWVVLSVGMMGFLNKFMDTMGIELEEAAIGDVEDLIGPTGWKVGKHGWNSEPVDEFDMAGGRPLHPRKPATDPNGNGHGARGSANGSQPGYLSVPKDSLGTYLRVIRQAPGAIRKERQWTKGMASRIAPALLTLEADVGHSFPILASLHHSKAVRAIATVLRDNLDPTTSALGVRAKCLVGLVYARVVGNEVLTSEAIQLALSLVPDLDHPLLTAVGRFATAPPESATLPPQLTSVEQAAVMLAKVAAPSPSQVNEISIEAAAGSLTPAQIVETVVWLSVQQLLHRLYSFYDASRSIY